MRWKKWFKLLLVFALALLVFVWLRGNFKNRILNIEQRFSEKESEITQSLSRGLKLHLIEFETIKVVSPREIEVWLEEGILILFNSEKDVDIQLDSLQLILSRAKIEGKTIKKIDLRFDKPVIF